MSVSYFIHENKPSVSDGHVLVDCIKMDNLFYSESFENKKTKYATNKWISSKNLSKKLESRSFVFEEIENICIYLNGNHTRKKSETIQED